MKQLTVQDIELLHMQIIDASGGSQVLRDIARIEAVVATQIQSVFGQEVYQTIYDKAAALARGIIGDHPFVDGNKRTGIMAALLFLNLNGHDTSSLQDNELEDYAVRIATDHLSVPEIASWLEQHEAPENLS